MTESQCLVAVTEAFIVVEQVQTAALFLLALGVFVWIGFGIWRELR